MNVTFKPSNQNNQSKANKGQSSNNSSKQNSKPSNCNLKKNNPKSSRYSKITTNLAEKFLKYNFSVLENEKNDLRESEPSENKIHYSKANNSNTNDSNENQKENDKINRYQDYQDTENTNNRISVNGDKLQTIDTPKGNIIKFENNSKNNIVNFSNYQSKQDMQRYEKETYLKTNNVNVLPTPSSNNNNNNYNTGKVDFNSKKEYNYENKIGNTGNFGGYKMKDLDQDNKSVATHNTNITSQTTKNNYYKKMILFTKDSYNNKRDTKSCLSTRSKVSTNSNNTYTNRKSNPLLDSIFKNETINEKKKSNSLFKRLILSKCTYLDLSKEEFYSNEKSKQFNHYF